MKPFNSSLTSAAIRELVRYDEGTGVFTWIKTRTGSVRPGRIAGYLRKDGYVSIRIYGRNYPAHRLAWLYVTGAWPENQIDHINRCKSDNRFLNLRDVTASENRQNILAQKNNSSGFKGVSRDVANARWRAGIKHGGKSKNLGNFTLPEDAAKAYAAAANELHTKNPLAKSDPGLMKSIQARAGQFGSPGESNPMAKLVSADVARIRSSALPAKELASLYGVTVTTVHHIRKRVTWKHLHEERRA